MKIKQEEKGLLSQKIIAQFLWNKRKWFQIIIGTSLIFITFWLLLGQFEPQLKKRITNYLILRVGKVHLVPRNYIESSFFAKPAHFDLNIKHKHYQKLAYQRTLSMKKGTLIDNLEEIPVTINYQNKAYKGKARIKGKLKDHWENEEEWSLKIKIKGEDAIMGMRNFALQHPQRRNFLNEWIFHKMASQLGLIHLRYDFVEININGRKNKIYALEEGLEKLLIENNDRKEGIIVEFNKDYYWTFGKNLLIESLQGADISPFQAKKILATDHLRSYFEKANLLINLFKEGKLKTSDIFDVEQMATIFAMNGLFGHPHSLQLANIRFYYNPITAKLEPIAYDQEFIMPIENFMGLIGEERKIGKINRINQSGEVDFAWYNQLFADKEFYALYLRTLERISKKEFLDNFFSKIEPEMKSKLRILHLDFPNYSFDEKSILYQNQQYIAHNIDPKEKIYTYQKSIDIENNKLEVVVKNVCVFPISIKNLIINDSINIPPITSQYIEACERNNNAEKKLIVFDLPKKIPLNDSANISLKIEYKFLENHKNAYTPVLPWSDSSSTIMINDLPRAKGNIIDYEFLEIDSINKIVSISPGNYVLKNDLIIPTGFEVRISGGVTIDLNNKSSILTYSPIFVEGTESKHVKFFSSDSTGQGVLIFQTQKESYLEFVDFDNLSNPNNNNWSVSGAVTFYHAPVHIRNCSFSRNRGGDDLLNLVHSDFTIKNSSFYKTNADALDADFSNGYIEQTIFEDVGNDGIDISGSKLKINQVSINKIGDKGVSAGERSLIEIKNTKIKNSELAVTSKDNSIVKLDYVAIDSSKVGFIAFQKKPEFGPGQIIAQNTVLAHVYLDYLLEQHSSLIINDTIRPYNRKNLEEALYGNEFGKSSK